MGRGCMESLKRGGFDSSVLREGAVSFTGFDGGLLGLSVQNVYILGGFTSEEGVGAKCTSFSYTFNYQDARLFQESLRF